MTTRWGSVLAAMSRREVALAAVVAAVASAVLLAYRALNPGGAAELYFAEHEHHQLAHRLMQICYVVVMSAAAFNLRFVAVELARPIFSVYKADATRTKSPPARG